MNRHKFLYLRHRFPPDIIQTAVWLYHRFSLSHRDIEDLFAERGVMVSYETIRRWCNIFGPRFARRLRRRYGQYGDTWHVDEVFIRVLGKQHYLYRAVDQDGDVIEKLVQKSRDTMVAVRFFRRVMRGQDRGPRRLVTDKLKSYPAAHHLVMPDVVHISDQYANNRGKFRTSGAGNENGRCDGSSWSCRRNDFCRYTTWFRTCCDSGGTYCARKTTVCFG